MNDTYICLDLETTGLSVYEDEIIEIAMARCVNDEITDRYETFVKPVKRISSTIYSITGISNEMTENAPAIRDIIEEIMDFIGSETVLGHNVGFDYRFLAKAAADSGIKYSARVIDTYMLSKKYIKDIKSRSLENLCAYYGIENIHHRAGADVISTIEVYKRLKQTEGFRPVIKEMFFSNTGGKPATQKQINYLKNLIMRYNVDFENEPEKLTMREASAEIDRILSEYGIMRRRNRG